MFSNCEGLIPYAGEVALDATSIHKRADSDKLPRLAD